MEVDMRRIDAADGEDELRVRYDWVMAPEISVVRVVGSSRSSTFTRMMV